MTDFRTPRPLATGDVLSDFRCGVDVLDSWLRGYARNNDRSGGSKTMVSVTTVGRVAGYYCLSASSLVREDAPQRLAHRALDPIPVVLIGRLAIDQEFTGLGLGTALLQHAVLQAISAAEIIGMRAILVHALTDDVIPFYERFGFERFPGSSRALYLLVSDARATLVG
ncbi:GNAT family N-acetyltransferase [Plantibacter sp. MCCC 1A11337]|uniref:GNAT family N-acetyltransferase n=1 Tax=Plantibacter sp. MCCC 1A11337 TaxID=2736644 RepID=UPI001581DE04|nr:GNAT family N-acetyltransferase [Plantibacter sp. MCCC 1A11337]NUJ88065.1 GNAT family N-acetyltransferase [Plantibacter sp. MCCC 1A11337]